MESLFKYLISKDNKNKVGTSLKRSLRTGDIVVIDKDYYIFFTAEDFDKYFEYYRDRLPDAMKYWYPCKEKLRRVETGLFVDPSGEWMPYDEYTEDLKYYRKQYNVTAIYYAKNPGISDIMSVSWVNKEVKKRNMKEIK